MDAALWPARGIPANNQFLRLCEASYNRQNWLSLGSELAGQRAAVVVVTRLVQSSKLNGLDPWAHLRDVLARIHSHPHHRLDDLLPHRWRPD